MDEAQLTAELRVLDSDARLVLAVFATVGRASLSVAEVGELAGLRDARPTIDELERRGLVVREGGDRYAVVAGTQSRLRRMLASADVVDRVLRDFARIAEDGRLTIDDLDAVTELTRIAAETGRWALLLRLAEASETVLSTTHRVDEWVEIVERRLEAARVVGDDEAALRAEAELDRLARRATQPAGSQAQQAQGGASGGGLRIALAVLGGAVVGAAGLAVGYVAGDRAGSGSDATTATVTETRIETVTGEGTTGTETETVTETSTETVTETTTETETTTVTEQPVG